MHNFSNMLPENVVLNPLDSFGSIFSIRHVKYTNHILFSLLWFCGCQTCFFPFFFHHFSENKRKCETNRFSSKKFGPISEPKKSSTQKFPPRSLGRWPQGTSPLLWLWHGSLALNRRVQLGMSRQDGVLVLLFTGALGDEGISRDATG